MSEGYVIRVPIPTGIDDCKQFFLTYSKEGYCCDFHDNMMGYLQSDVWHLLNPRKFRIDFGFTIEQFREEMSDMKKAVNEGKTIMYRFEWYTKTTDRDVELRNTLSTKGSA